VESLKVNLEMVPVMSEIAKKRNEHFVDTKTQRAQLCQHWVRQSL